MAMVSRLHSSLLIIPLILSCAGYRSLFDVSATILEIVNLQTDLQPLQTGFLVGRAGENTTRVEISLDGSALQAADGTTSWRYALPMAARQWRLNSVHTIAIRAVNGAGNVVAELTRRVRKDHNRDLNGDGYPELVIASQLYNSNRGRTYVYFGGSASIQNLTRAIIEGDNANDYCWHNNLDDIDLDGYADLFVGCSMNLGTGRLGIFYGDANFSGTKQVSSANALITGGTADEFSYLQSAADFNGDGFPDFAVGASNYNSYDGRLYIFYGSGTRIGNIAASSAQTIITGVAADSGFGAYTSGDINGDGYDDLVATSYDLGGGNGRAYIFYGQSAYIASVSSTSADRMIDGEGIGAYFGSSPTVADLNGDGYGDVIIAAPRYNIATSKVYIFYGAGTGIAITTAGAANTIITGEANSALGRPLVGAVTATGANDLLIGGIKWNNNDTGKLVLIRGQASFITSVNASAITEFITGDTTNLRFGAAQVLWYRNGSGNPTLCVGAPMFNSNQGKAFLYENIQGRNFPGGSVVPDTTLLPDTLGEVFGDRMTGSP